jgi:hypothetical protein
VDLTCSASKLQHKDNLPRNQKSPKNAQINIITLITCKSGSEQGMKPQGMPGDHAQHRDILEVSFPTHNPPPHTTRSYNCSSELPIWPPSQSTDAVN